MFLQFFRFLLRFSVFQLYNIYLGVSRVFLIGTDGHVKQVFLRQLDSDREVFQSNAERHYIIGRFKSRFKS
jgi:hypothetical protein